MLIEYTSFSIYILDRLPTCTHCVPVFIEMNKCFTSGICQVYRIYTVSAFVCDSNCKPRVSRVKWLKFKVCEYFLCLVFVKYFVDMIKCSKTKPRY